MPLVPNFLDRLIFLRLNKAPGIFLDIIQASILRVVAVALKLGVFDALAESPKNAAELARSIQTDARGTKLLLEFLTTTGYVKKSDNIYSNSPMTVKWLERSSPTSFATGVDFFQNIVFPFWDAHLEESILAGKPSITIYEWLDHQPGGWKLLQDWLASTARFSSPEILSKAPLLPNAKRLLDIGGGHGLYSIEFCKRYPGLTATVLDQPEPLVSAKKNIDDAKLGNRVSVREGDYTKDDLGTGNDVALLFNVIHAHSPDQNIELFKRVAKALSPQGMIIIQEQIESRTSSPAARSTVQFLGLTFLTSLGGQTYRFDQIANWLTKAGFSAPKRVNLRRIPGIAILLATKAS